MTPAHFQILALAKAIGFYRNTGLRVNTAYTPSNMLKTASRLTGKTYRRGELAQAEADLRNLLQEA